MGTEDGAVFTLSLSWEKYSQFFSNNVKQWDQKPGTWNSGPNSGPKDLIVAGNIGPIGPSFLHCKMRELNTIF